MKRTLFSPERRCQLTKKLRTKTSRRIARLTTSLAWISCLMLIVPRALPASVTLHKSQSIRSSLKASAAISQTAEALTVTTQIHPARRPRIGEGCWNVAL